MSNMALAGEVFEPLPPATVEALLLGTQNRLAELASASLRDAVVSSVTRSNAKDLLSVGMSPSDYSCASSYLSDSSAYAFLRKYEGLDGILDVAGLDPMRAAVDSFFEAEKLNELTNARLGAACAGYVPDDFRVIGERFQFHMSRLLGKAPTLAQLQPRFGPGSTSACSGDQVTIADKLIATPECYSGSASIVRNVIAQSTVWTDLLSRTQPCSMYKALVRIPFEGPPEQRTLCAPTIIPGNTWRAVPKNAKTHRGICIEGHAVSMVQLSVGTVLSDRLAREGLDKTTQPYRQRQWSRLCQATKHATVDMRMASELLAYQAIRFALLQSPGWFDLLDCLRAPRTRINGEWIELEKFSSMGNGFTFELETLFFYAAALAVADENGQHCPQFIGVFGDDVIIPQHLVSRYYAFIEWLGAEVNKEKSFVDGRFFESCGTDWFDGCLVRPYYQKSAIKNILGVYTLYNGLYRVWSSHDGLLDDRIRPTLDFILSFIPQHLRIFGPMDVSDNWLIAERSHRPNWCFSPQAQKRLWDRYCEMTIYTVALYSSHSPLLDDDIWSKIRYQRRNAVRGTFSGLPPCVRLLPISTVSFSKDDIVRRRGDVGLRGEPVSVKIRRVQAL